MTTTLVPIATPSTHGLTMDDLEALMGKYGGMIERNEDTDMCTLVGAVIDGRTVNVGPVPMEVVGTVVAR